MFQHSVFSVPDRAHGYCVDDNARALILMCRNTQSNSDDVARLMHAYAGFVQHAWNNDTCAFRNFMSFDRRWLEAEGSGDSCGRTVWALAIAATESSDIVIRDWATGLFDQTIASIAARHSPRTRAFLMIAASTMLALQPNDIRLSELLTEFGDDLVAKLADCSRSEWRWFEPVLAYDNGRLSEALLRTGVLLERNDFVVRGLETLTWLAEQQTAAAGHYRPVGSDSFGRAHASPLPFDQQPIEAWAMIDACDAAFAATGDSHWKSLATRAYRWFLGDNDLGLAIANPATGECFDGLMPTGVNRNQGAESVLAFHIATHAINRLLVSAVATASLRENGRYVVRHEVDEVAPVPAVGQTLPFIRVYAVMPSSRLDRLPNGSTSECDVHAAI